MLDVIAIRQDLTAPDVEVVDVGLSDNSLLQWSASSACPMMVIEIFVRRLWRSLDINDFQSALLSALCLPNGLHCLDPDMMASLHDAKLNAILDRAIPVHTVTRRPLPGIPTFQHRRLQSFLNAAAKLIRRSSHHEHVTPLLRDLHWLRSWEHIDFKSVMLVYRCLYGLLTISRIISNVSPATIANNFVHHHRHY